MNTRQIPFENMVTSIWGESWIHGQERWPGGRSWKGIGSCFALWDSRDLAQEMKKVCYFDEK